MLATIRQNRAAELREYWGNLELVNTKEEEDYDWPLLESFSQVGGSLVVCVSFGILKAQNIDGTHL